MKDENKHGNNGHHEMGMRGVTRPMAKKEVRQHNKEMHHDGQEQKGKGAMKMKKEMHRKMLEMHLFNKNGFNVPLPVPSLSTNEPAFDPGESVYIWRGPTWMMFNWFRHRFLLDKGYTQEAEAMLKSVKELISRSGFREYNHPFTGQGLGAHSFTWSGLVMDMIRSQMKETE